MQFAYPFQVNTYGMVETTTYNTHIRQLIEQVLFTAPGERVNRPTFGCGLTGFVFASVGNEMVTVTQSIVHSALQEWLGDLIKVELVSVEIEEATLTVFIQYVTLQTQQRSTAKFER